MRVMDRDGIKGDSVVSYMAICDTVLSFSCGGRQFYVIYSCHASAYGRGMMRRMKQRIRLQGYSYACIHARWAMARHKQIGPRMRFVVP